MKTFCITYFFLLCIAGAYLAPMHAQESCYEQYLREHNKKILTAEDADDSYDELKKTVLAKQMYGESYLLMVDTVAQRAMITKVDGTYIADVHVALVDSTWYMWLSVDPLADKYIHLSPYLYCNGNPIMLIDPNGKTWTDIDGNEIQDHSQIRAYIFYNPDDFSSQTMTMYKQLEDKYGQGTVALSNVKTAAEFAEDWKSMGGADIAEININHHGSNQAIHLDYKNNQYITSTGNGRTQSGNSEAMNVSDLGLPVGNISNAILFLNTCHSNAQGNRLGNLRIGGHRIPGTSAQLVGNGETLLQGFRNCYSFFAVRGTSAGVSYNNRTMAPEPQFYFQSWTILLNLPVKLQY